MNKGLSWVGKLVASCNIFPDDIIEGNTAGSQLVLKVVQELELPLDPIAILEFSWGFDLSAIVGPSVFYVHVAGGILVNLKVPICFVSILIVAVVVFDPPNKAFQLVHKGITDAHATMIGGKLGDRGTDI